jgi:hypothetical protein
MRPIIEREFQTCEAPVIRNHLRVQNCAKRCFAAIQSIFQIRDALDRLPPRLRRDAGLDELDIERKRIARAPLIR